MAAPSVNLHINALREVRERMGLNLREMADRMRMSDRTLGDQEKQRVPRHVYVLAARQVELDSVQTELARALSRARTSLRLIGEHVQKGLEL
jgi:transcriptional regulator with XRE-family HTH domain